MAGIVGFRFRVHGRVQGVFFRKYTRQKAKELQLVGWVKNAVDGTVEGEAEGSPKSIQEMKHWLCNVGSPSSKIEKCEVTDYDVEKSNFSSFGVRE